MKKSGTERRKHKRFQVKGFAFAKLWSELEADYVQNIGQLLDISLGGISLRCFLETQNAGGYLKLGIFLSGGDFKIDKIPFKIVSDIEMNCTATLSSRNLRRYGIKFDKLTPDQQAKLDNFFLHHTVGEAKCPQVFAMDDDFAQCGPAQIDPT
ncbi:MAG: PilZ domain-containing protein [Proteobacteria bacterium]|nr:PilZ domain-containing protein [Pseudomonadota bacterium]